ncbi:hypothetical protein Y032_0631g860 [Ancylostoma ceylanicum]|uniref:Uncharacterized protein n=1 Tax=Ancylostoma ceylanicum TaxID=53326 RepID=A0A016WKB7_9BILA|nr:hypothetical protein Y032_0631g860 [Ancylostoma ceylanicum]
MQELIAFIKDRNRDPVIETALHALQTLAAKVPMELSAQIEAETRAPTIVISGLEEADNRMLPSQHQADVENKVTKILDVLNVQCRPSAVFRIGKIDNSRLVKVLLPSAYHWRSALANARLLRSSSFSNVFIRRSMTSEERKHDFGREESSSYDNRRGS